MLQEFVEQHFPEVNPGVKARLACFYAHRELSDTGQVIASIDTMDLFLRQIQRAKFLGSQERNPWYQAPRQ